MPAGGHPTAVAYSDDASSIVVATHNLSGSSLYMFGEEKPKPSENKPQAKLPLPEIKWEHHKVHDKKAILTLFGATASYGSADGSTLIASCSEGTFKIFFPTSKVVKQMPCLSLYIRDFSPNKLFNFVKRY